MSQFPELPRLDCHAHIAPDVSEKQLKQLGNVVVFAMTRTLNEAFRAAQRNDSRVMWGWGAHPGLRLEATEYDLVIMEKLIKHFPIIGEVGLDRRGSADDQQALLNTILTAAENKPVLISIHSAGSTRHVVNMISRHRHPGVILHWFMGSKNEIYRASTAGAYFSVNSAMPIEVLRNIPLERILPETDYPAIQGPRGSRQPGDTMLLEEALANIYNLSELQVRVIFWENLKKIVMLNKMQEKLPKLVNDVFFKLESEA